jgi:hypothetical protein
MTGWVEVYSTNQEFQAAMVQELLANQGIASTVLNRKDSMYLIGDILIMVEEKDVEAARQIIEASAL